MQSAAKKNMNPGTTGALIAVGAAAGRFHLPRLTSDLYPQQPSKNANFERRFPRLPSLQEEEVKLGEKTQTKDDQPVSDFCSSSVFVDKSNPFIGYFQATKTSLRKTQQPKLPSQLSKLFCFTNLKKNNSHDQSTRKLDLTHSSLAIETRNSKEKNCSSAGPICPTEDGSLTTPGHTPNSSRYEKDFEEMNILGRGGQGTVVEASNKIDGGMYAIKKVELPKNWRFQPGKLEQALREVRSMAVIPPHLNVVRYHTAWIEEHEDVEENDQAEQVVEPIEEPSMYSSCSSTASDCGFDFDYSSSSEEYDEAPVETNQESKQLLLFGHEKQSSYTLYIQMELCKYKRCEEEDIPSCFSQGRHKPASVSTNQAEYGNLTEWLRCSKYERSSAKVREGLKYFTDIVEGVRHIHSCGVIHRDLKPDNVFIQDNVAKIGDFGLSKVVGTMEMNYGYNEFQVASNESEHTTALGTYLYASPEQLSSSAHAKYSKKSDIFALGVILLEILSPFDTMMERSRVLSSVRHGGIPQDILVNFPAEKELVKKMTSLDPKDRPTAEQVLEQLYPITKKLHFNELSFQNDGLDELKTLHSKLSRAVYQLSEKSQATIMLEALVSELAEKMNSYEKIACP